MALECKIVLIWWLLVIAYFNIANSHAKYMIYQCYSSCDMHCLDISHSDLWWTKMTLDLYQKWQYLSVHYEFKMPTCFTWDMFQLLFLRHIVYKLFTVHEVLYNILITYHSFKTFTNWDLHWNSILKLQTCHWLDMPKTLAGQTLPEKFHSRRQWVFNDLGNSPSVL